MKIYLVADHGGLELKNQMKMYLQEKGYDVEDCGAFSLDPFDDYPDIITAAAKKTSHNSASRCIIFGKAGAGEVIVANKIPGVRAVFGFSRENVVLAREHTDANVLSIGSAFVSPELGKELIQLFLDTPFTGAERYMRRLQKITEIEKENQKL